LMLPAVTVIALGLACGVGWIVHEPSTSPYWVGEMTRESSASRASWDI